MRARALLYVGDLPHWPTALILWLLRDRSVKHRGDHVVLRVDLGSYTVYCRTSVTRFVLRICASRAIVQMRSRTSIPALCAQDSMSHDNLRTTPVV